MSKSTDQLPILGQPVFRISQHALDGKVDILGQSNLFNALTYFAVDAIQVKSMEYLDDTMRKVIINKNRSVEGMPDVSAEIILDLDANNSRNEHKAIYVSEVEAQLVARTANELQKKQAKKLLDLAGKAFSEYDSIIAACKAG